ncbi:hypothetical protein LIS04_200 [Listeria phage LIS04]|nr:hypothetical protein LIS04_200 [Listeria phage LIS04]
MLYYTTLAVCTVKNHEKLEYLQVYSTILDDGKVIVRKMNSEDSEPFTIDRSETKVFSSLVSLQDSQEVVLAPQSARKYSLQALLNRRSEKLYCFCSSDYGNKTRVLVTYLRTLQTDYPDTFSQFYSSISYVIKSISSILHNKYVTEDLETRIDSAITLIKQYYQFAVELEIRLESTTQWEVKKALHKHDEAITQLTQSMRHINKNPSISLNSSTNMNQESYDKYVTTNSEVSDPLEVHSDLSAKSESAKRL